MVALTYTRWEFCCTNKLLAVSPSQVMIRWQSFRNTCMRRWCHLEFFDPICRERLKQ
jgi:hypothetical protein